MRHATGAYFRLLCTMLCMLATLVAQAQPERELDHIDSLLRKGDRQALWKLKEYIGNKKEFTDHLGYHILQSTIREKALRVLAENTLFLPRELNLDETLTPERYGRFLAVNEKTIKYSSSLLAFYITPLEERNDSCRLTNLTNTERDRIRKEYGTFDSLSWYPFIKEEYLSRNNHVLQSLAEMLVADRDRWDEYYFFKKEILCFVEMITHSEIGIWDADQQTWNYHPDDDNAHCMEIAVFLSRHYKNYTWNKEAQYFTNTVDSIHQADAMSESIEKLFHGPDSMYVVHFEQVTDFPPARLEPALETLERNDFGGFLTSHFTYGFVKAAARLKEYCRQQQISYTASPGMLRLVGNCYQSLSIGQRLRYEDSLIRLLSPETVTAFEYRGIVNGDGWGNTSFSRVLDIYYSAHMAEIVRDKKQLSLYLKKAMIFDEIGIIGTVNTYLWKLLENKPETVNALQALQASPDEDIKTAAARALNQIRHPKKTEKETISWDGNKDIHASDLGKELEALKHKEYKDSYGYSNALDKLFSGASYDQIPELIRLIEGMDSTKYRRTRIIDFLQDDFGFPVSWTHFNLAEFKEKYAALNEEQLYAYYLDKEGVVYKKTDGTLDYPAIYRILKFNINVAFIGGGGGYYEYGVYPVIKILEKTFGTTLGFPQKRCNWQGMYSCDCIDRAKRWITFLKGKKLIPLSDSEAPTWSYQ